MLEQKYIKMIREERESKQDLELKLLQKEQIKKNEIKIKEEKKRLELELQQFKEENERKKVDMDMDWEHEQTIINEKNELLQEASEFKSELEFANKAKFESELNKAAL